MTDWILFASVAIAAGLIVSTTIMTTLNPHSWRFGIGVSASRGGNVGSRFAIREGGKTVGSGVIAETVA